MTSYLSRQTMCASLQGMKITETANKHKQYDTHTHTRSQTGTYIPTQSYIKIIISPDRQVEWHKNATGREPVGRKVIYVVVWPP